MPAPEVQKVYTIEAVIDAQQSHSEDAVLEIYNEDSLMSSPEVAPSDRLPTEVAGANASGMTTCSDSKATTPITTSSTPKTDEPAPSTLSSATTESLSTTKLPTTPEATAPSVEDPSTWSEQLPVPISLDNWSGRVNIDTSTLRKDVSIFNSTKQMMREETSQMLVLASRGFGRAGYVPTKKTSPRLRTRRYSIDVLVKPWTFEKDWQWKADVRYEASPAVQKHHENEPRLRAEPIQAFPTPLRYRELNVRAMHPPPHDDETYLVMGDSVLPNMEFNFMLHHRGGEAWMRDNALAMSLDVLERALECHKYGISIVNPNAAQIIFMASRCDDADEASYDVYRDRLQDKRWIVLPINDGIGAYSDGSHWSLVIVDRVHKTAFYYDSTGVSPYNQIQKIAYEVSKGLLMVLGEETKEWQFLPQEESPNQWWDNQFTQDQGPCGPFVWKMAKIMIEKIIAHQQTGHEADCDLSLHRGFDRYFKSMFDSWLVRLEMQQFITWFKLDQESLTSVEEHDQIAVEGEDVAMSQELPAVYLEPERPASENSTETSSEDEQDEDPAVSLNRVRGGGISLVGEDDSIDDLSADASSTMFDDSPPKDFNINDWDMMDNVSFVNGSRAKVRGDDLSGCDPDTTPTRGKSDQRRQFQQQILQQDKGPTSRKRHAEPATADRPRPRPRTPPEQNVDVGAPLPEGWKRSNSVESHWSDMSG
ncbi:hypothetical protein HBH52_176820 [Parastagonospora nodorum]|nr:hypothetical protein HBH52_176820 [Parastagonospora nodorum]